LTTAQRDLILTAIKLTNRASETNASGSQLWPFAKQAKNTPVSTEVVEIYNKLKLKTLTAYIHTCKSEIIVQ